MQENGLIKSLLIQDLKFLEVKNPKLCHRVTNFILREFAIKEQREPDEDESRELIELITNHTEEQLNAFFDKQNIPRFEDC